MRYNALNKRDECTRYDSRLLTQRDLGTTNKQITSSRDMNAEIGGCPMRAAIKNRRLFNTSRYKPASIAFSKYRIRKNFCLLTIK